MANVQMTKEEIARRAKEWYESRIREQVEPGNNGKFLAIDAETGEYEMDEDQLAATDRLFDKRRRPTIFVMRIGYPAATRLGGQFRIHKP